MSLQEEMIIPDYDAPAAQPAPAQQPAAGALAGGDTIFDAPVAGAPTGGTAQVATHWRTSSYAAGRSTPYTECLVKRGGMPVMS
jgi:hypothetical protein